MLAWHEGWQAESAGDLATASKRYEEAERRDPRLIGVRLDRLRLLALSPDALADAKDRLDKLLKAEPHDPRVASFAAIWALWQGDAKLAGQRLEAARPVQPDDPADVAPTLAQARAMVAAAQGRWPEAWQLASTGATFGPKDASWRASVAWNAGPLDPGHAETLRLTASLPPGRQKALLQALLAAEQGRWPDVVQALASLQASEVTPLVLVLRARAALAQGDAAQAVGLAAQALQGAPDDMQVQELWAVALLQLGQTSQARDALLALTSQGGGWTAWHHLGVAWLRLGDMPQATASFRMAAQRCPTCAVPARNLAVLARISGP